MAECVVILHGIFRTQHSMRRLAKFLEQSGFDVLNLNYPSTKLDLATLADTIHPQVSSFISQHPGKVHFIGFSMGGLLIRTYIKKYRPANLGRVVTMGTPHQGSEVADFLMRFPLYKTLYGPAGQQLITRQETFSDIFGEVDFEFGSIAGNKPIDFICSRIIGKPNDGKVSVESTKVQGMKDHVVLPCNHTFFPVTHIAWTQTLHFLENGRFSKN